jgi:hypothetical protein
MTNIVFSGVMAPSCSFICDDPRGVYLGGTSYSE